MESVAQRKASRATTIQFEKLIDYMERNRDLREGKLTTHFTKEDRKKKWKELSEILNSSGVKKTADQWRKYWSDQKNYIRCKRAKILKYKKSTEGEPLTGERLTLLEDRVLKMSSWVSAAKDEIIPNHGLPLENQTTESLGIAENRSTHDYTLPEPQIQMATENITAEQQTPASSTRKRKVRDRSGTITLRKTVDDLAILIRKQNCFLATIADASLTRAEEAQRQSYILSQILESLQSFRNENE